jgi:hypothetical protein
MNLLKTTLTAALLFSSTYASAISFTSGTDDVCTTGTCTVTSQTTSNWVNPIGTPLEGASWIQTSSSWKVNNSSYSFYELDLSNSVAYNLTSLFVSYDDDLLISIGDTVIFDSTTTNITKSWTSYYDVFALASFDTYITSTDNLTFAVKNTGNGPTGVIWNGTASIPEPSMFFVLGFGLIALAYKRNRNNKA